MEDWIHIAEDIKVNRLFFQKNYYYIQQNNYEKYDAFIILHGTDTMAYTASALSFMLENLSKTVILTGFDNLSIIYILSKKRFTSSPFTRA